MLGWDVAGGFRGSNDPIPAHLIVLVYVLFRRKNLIWFEKMAGRDSVRSIAGNI